MGFVSKCQSILEKTKTAGARFHLHVYPKNDQEYNLPQLPLASQRRQKRFLLSSSNREVIHLDAPFFVVPNTYAHLPSGALQKHSYFC